MLLASGLVAMKLRNYKIRINTEAVENTIVNIDRARKICKKGSNGNYLIDSICKCLFSLSLRKTNN